MPVILRVYVNHPIFEVSNLPLWALLILSMCSGGARILRVEGPWGGRAKKVRGHHKTINYAKLRHFLFTGYFAFFKIGVFTKWHRHYAYFKF